MPVEHEPQKILHIPECRAAFEEHHLELIVEERHVLRDREIAAVIAHLAQAARMSSAASRRWLPHRTPANRGPARSIPPPSMPVCPARAFSGRAHCDRRCAHPDPRPPSAGNSAKRLPSAHVTWPTEMRCGTARFEHFRGALHVAAHSISMASTLAVPAGRMPSGTSRMHHALGHFVDGAVAARRDNQIGAAIDVLARHRAGGLRPRGGHHRHRVAVLGENLHRARQQRTAASPQFARTRIVDQDSISSVSCL